MNKQVCKNCGSTEVARCKWVNVNTDKIYDADSGTTLEWCFECREETGIVDESEYNKEAERYREFLQLNFNSIKAEQLKFEKWGGNSLNMAIEEVAKDLNESFDFGTFNSEEIENDIFS